MTVRVLNADDSVSEIPNVKWHPAYAAKTAPNTESSFPAGLWVRKSDLIRHYEAVNKFRSENKIKERDISKVIENIVCGEAEFEIYDDDTNPEPWRHFGTLTKRVAYGRSDDWWNLHA